MSQSGQGPVDPILKPRDLGQLLDQSFKVFGRFWKPLIAVGSIGAVPSLLPSLMVLTIFPATTPSGRIADNWAIRIFDAAERGDFSGLTALFGVFGLVGLAILLLWPLFQGALIDVATRAVLHMPPVPLGESLRVGARRYWALLGTTLLKLPIWLLGFVAMVIGGLVIFSFVTVPLGFLALGVVLAFSGHAIVVEGRGGGAPALSRSYELGKSRFWPLMGIGIVFNLLISVIQSVITMPFSLGTGLAMAAAESPALVALPYFIQGLATAVSLPFLMVGLTLTYFDTRIRREGYDLEMLARQQEQGQEPGPFTAPPPDQL